MVSGIVNPIALRKAKIVYHFGLSECNRVNKHITNFSYFYSGVFAIVVFGKFRLQVGRE